MLFAVLRPAGFFVVALTLSAAAHAQEQQVAIKAADENATVRLLTAPHTGKNMCDLPHGTALTFIKRADHGPHKFARVIVGEGDCAGMEVFVPWISLDPEPVMELLTRR